MFVSPPHTLIKNPYTFGTIGILMQQQFVEIQQKLEEAILADIRNA